MTDVIGAYLPIPTTIHRKRTHYSTIHMPYNIPIRFAVVQTSRTDIPFL